MGLFDSKEENERERRYGNAVQMITLFPGSVAEYQMFRGYEVEIIDTQRRDQGVTIIDRDIRDKELRNYLAEQGIEAIVHATKSYTTAGGGGIGSERYYGLPVRKKK